MQKQAIRELTNMLPEYAGSFEGSVYRLPVAVTFLGDNPPDIRNLKRELIRKQDGDVKELLEPVLLAAELCEAACPDRDRYFVTDQALQSKVFMGSKWMAGWALVLGAEGQEELLEKLKEKGFMVFCDIPGVPDTIYIGNRSTSPVYFLQMMVRYGLIWGGIAPGDDHEMGHFLERDLPGLMILCKDLEPLKYITALGLMKLGAPALVPSTFPFPYGTRIVADGMEDILAKCTAFPNLRMRFYKDEVITLPPYCNTAYANEKIDTGRTLGGENSFICLRYSGSAEKGWKFAVSRRGKSVF